MFRKSLFAIIVAIMVIFTSFSSFAFTTVLDVLKSKDVKSTDEFLVSIIRPEGDETISKKSYVICGNAVDEAEDIRVHILIENNDGKWEEFKNTDGESSWDIGASGIFMKEVVFPNEGINSIRVAAYKKSEIKDLKAGENLQINDFKITVLPEGFWSTIRSINVLKYLKSFVGVE